MVDISIVIPAAQQEPCLLELLDELRLAGWHGETIVCGNTKPDGLPESVQWVKSHDGRAASLNSGADAAKGDFLWFLHADSRVKKANLQTVARFAKTHPDAVGYFGLRFHDGGLPMRLTEAGIWLRCRLLDIPFGDQGLCMAKTTFKALGGYDEIVSYGEDHIFILNAKRQETPIRPVNGTLATSARKYRKHGWLRTTWRHQYLWWKQLGEYGRPS